MTPRCHCARLVDGRRPKWSQWWRLTISDIEKTRSSCETCAIVFEAAETLLGPAFVHYFHHFYFPARDDGDNGPLRVNLESYYYKISAHISALGVRPIEAVQMQIYTSPGCHTPLNVIGTANHISHSGLSESCINLAKTWLKSCTGQEGRHSKCAPEIRSELPTRVIDLGTSSSDPLRLKVCSAKEKGQYVALSHCWGGSTPIMTTTQNIDAFTKSIPMPLPKTFADAVSVTRALDIQYLWIDSLCIIQDSPEDWSDQAPHMATVYGGAYVTIAADAASDSSEGFLEHPNRKFNKEVEVDYPGRAQGGPIWVRERGSLAYQLPFHDFNARLPVPQGDRDAPLPEPEKLETLRKINRSGDTPVSKLSTRGWVFQERALSQRTIHFGKAEMAWECTSLIDCECRAFAQRYNRKDSLMKQAISTMSWTKVLEEYTRLNLTVPEDRMAALSGLAEVRSRHETPQRASIRLVRKLIPKSHKMAGSYVAGTFESDMKAQLLWYTSFPAPALASYIAPTWSWASVSGAVKYNCPAADLGEWTILSYSCPAQGKSAFGNVKPGSYAVIHGLLADAHAQRHVGRDSETSWRLVPAGYTSKVEEPKVTILWDSEDRKRAAVLDGESSSLVFFVATDKGSPLRGLLLKECPETEPVTGSDVVLRGRMRSFRRFERVAFVEEHRLAVSRRDNWSDSSSDEDAPVRKSGEAWRFWNQHSSWQDLVCF